RPGVPVQNPCLLCKFHMEGGAIISGAGERGTRETLAKRRILVVYVPLRLPQRGDGLLRMIGDHVSKHTELSTDSKPLSYPFRLLVEKSELLRQRPEHAKMPDDIRTKTRPYFGMTVPPV